MLTILYFVLHIASIIAYDHTAWHLSEDASWAWKRLPRLDASTNEIRLFIAVDHIPMPALLPKLNFCSKLKERRVLPIGLHNLQDHELIFKKIWLTFCNRTTIIYNKYIEAQHHLHDQVLQVRQSLTDIELQDAGDKLIPPVSRMDNSTRVKRGLTDSIREFFGIAGSERQRHLKNHVMDIEKNQDRIFGILQDMQIGIKTDSSLVDNLINQTNVHAAKLNELNDGYMELQHQLPQLLGVTQINTKTFLMFLKWQSIIMSNGGLYLQNLLSLTQMI